MRITLKNVNRQGFSQACIDHASFRVSGKAGQC